MPTLDVDNQVICQSGAIYRYLANEFGLYGSTSMERAIADQVHETLNEIIDDLIQIRYHSKEPEEKKVNKLNSWGFLSFSFCLSLRNFGV